MTTTETTATAVRPDTRTAVRDLLLTRGALTAAEIADELGLTSAGVRRHLEHLEADGAIAPVRRRPTGGRGRPARAFQLTAAGREPLRHGYDALAEDAMHALREVGGQEAVGRFARQRIRSIIGHVRPASGPDDVPRAVEDIAGALNEAGFAASVQDAGTGVQICQHHCPVWHVASHFPELCAAEQEVVSEIVGTHVQRLSTIAGGNCACTTNIPTGTVASAADLAATIPAAAGASTSGTSVERTNR